MGDVTHLEAPVTDQQRKEGMARQAEDLQRRILAAMKQDRLDPERSADLRYTQGTADGVRTAVGMLIAEMYAISCVHAAKRDALADRVKKLEQFVARNAARLSQATSRVFALEDHTKPRYRVKAVTRRR